MAQVCSTSRHRAPALGLRRLSLSLLIVACLAGSATAEKVDDAVLDRVAADFALPTLNGPNIRLSEARGEVVLLSFWSSWCGGCRAALTRSGELATTYRSAGLRVIGVNLDEDRARAQAFAQRYPSDYSQALDVKKSVAEAYRISSLPYFVLIDRNGVTRFVQSDALGLDNDSLIKKLRSLLNE